jgi:hypothetical protein
MSTVSREELERLRANERTLLLTQANTQANARHVTWQDPEAVVVVGAEAPEVRAVRVLKTIGYVLAQGVVLALLMSAALALQVPPLRAFLAALAAFLAWQVDAWASSLYFNASST